jgi:acyl dehydratase
MNAIYWEDYVIGSERNTFGRTITETDIVLHAGQSGDFYPHHMDAEWCSQQNFRQRIAHGTLIFTVAVGLTANVINPIALSYGYDHLRFVKPVFIGDTIRVKVTIREKKEHRQAEMGIISEALEVSNQHGKVVMVCEHLLLAQRRQPLES